MNKYEKTSMVCWSATQAGFLIGSFWSDWPWYMVWAPALIPVAAVVGFFAVCFALVCASLFPGSIIGGIVSPKPDLRAQWEEAFEEWRRSNQDGKRD